MKSSRFTSYLTLKETAERSENPHVLMNTQNKKINENIYRNYTMITIIITIRWVEKTFVWFFKKKTKYEN